MRKILFAILGVLLLLIAACGQAGTPVAPEGKMEDVAPEEAAPMEGDTELEEVTFGWMGALTGNIATLGTPIKESVELAVEEVNNKQLIPGKTMKVVYEDDKCEAANGATAAQKLVSVDKVTAIIGPMCSPTMLAAAPLVEENGVLTVSYSATAPSIKDAGDFIFRVVPSDSGQGVLGAELAKDTLGAEKAVVVYIQNDWGQGLHDVFTTKAKEIGLDVRVAEAYAPDETDFRTIVAKVKAAQVDVIYLAAFPADGAVLLKQLKEAGFDKTIIAADALKDDSIMSAVQGAEYNMIVTIPGVPKSQELENFANAFQAKFNKEYTAYTPEAYDVVMILAKACAETDCTSTAMKDFLYTMGEYVGASGTYAFDTDGEVSKPYDLFQIVDGKWSAYGSDVEEMEVSADSMTSTDAE
ncbi:hypothetical protein COV18_04155 [Candidatus Woesearchaeota archaeon CG10_big_fil_rev_8_21_14_0_10_37_12]|nr:MAG: hypothetical protein COV18_04155 [Candidatus Woesearchaeota archaeon CG10_big_fil_rev_8_21_14_0_10_37_12]